MNAVAIMGHGPLPLPPGSVPSRGTEPQEGPAAEGIAALANVGWQILLTVDLATIAPGVTALVWPGETLRVVGVLFGVYLLVTGVFLLALWIGFR